MENPRSINRNRFAYTFRVISAATLLSIGCAMALVATKTGMKHAPEKVGKEHGPNRFLNLAELRPQAPDSEEDRGGAARWELEARLPQGATNIDPSWYRKAIAAANNMDRYASVTRTLAPSVNAAPDAVLPPWRELGPSNIGGRTRAILIHPTIPTTMYAAGVAGGVWKSTDSGASWTQLTDLGLPNLAVTNLIFDPANPNTIYAATGEGFFNGDAVRGAGIFKSTDAGANWTQLASTNNSDFYFVNRLIASPNNGQRLYAATSTGLFRSLDGGATFANIKDATAVNGCMDVQVQPNRDPAFVFAACGTFATDGIYRFVDNNFPVTPAQVFTTANMGRTSLAIAPSNPSVIYAMSAAINGAFGNALLGVFRSTADGASGTWTTQVSSNSPPPQTDAAYQNLLLLNNPVYAYTVCVGSSKAILGQGWYDNILAVDPTNPNVVFSGGIDLFRSDDGGVNWGIMSYWYYPTADSHYAHADNHALVFHPQYNGTSNQTLFVGSDGGLFRTDNARAATASGFPDGNATPAACSDNTASVTWVNLNNGYNVTQFQHGLPYPDGNTYFGGTQDNGTLRGTSLPWSTLAGGDGGYVGIDPTNTNVIFQEYTGLSLRKSTNGGATFANSVTGISGDNFPFYTVHRLDLGNPQRMWLGGTRMWRSTNQAASWASASTAITSGSITSMAISSANGNFVLAGTASGRIAYVTNALSTTSTTPWNLVFAFDNGAGRVSWLEWQPGSTSVAYATSSTFGALSGGVASHVLKTMNNGASWTRIDGTLPNKIPDIPVWTIAVDPANNNHLYVGTDIGVFTTIDGGANWYQENIGFANVPVYALAFDNTSHLFAFTHGRGAWEVSTEALCTNFFENFDGVAAPALPAGWTATNAQGAAPLWVTSTTTPDMPPNDAFVDDPPTVSDKELDTPGILITSASAQVSFRNSYNLESSGGSFYDGGVLEVSSPNINGGAFTDITDPAVAGNFVTGGYVGVISNCCGNPLTGRMAWSGNSGGYINTVANLGPNVVGQTIRLRFRMGSDSSATMPGWQIDGVAVTTTDCPLRVAVSRKVHGGAGAFDINLPLVALSGAVGIEDRSASGQYQVVAYFSDFVTVGSVAVTSGTGAATFSTAGPVATVNLTGVTNAQRLGVTLSNVTVGARHGDITIPMGVLIGDVNASGAVNASDVSQTKLQSGQPATAGNFRADVVVTGSINATDVGAVKIQSGISLP